MNEELPVCFTNKRAFVYFNTKKSDQEPKEKHIRVSLPCSHKSIHFSWRCLVSSHLYSFQLLFVWPAFFLKFCNLKQFVTRSSIPTWMLASKPSWKRATAQDDINQSIHQFLGPLKSFTPLCWAGFDSIDILLSFVAQVAIFYYNINNTNQFSR